MLKRGLLLETDTIGQSIPLPNYWKCTFVLKIKTSEQDTIQVIDEIEF